MKDVLKELITLLKLKKSEENVYVGESQDLGYPQVFGGQVLGQSLVAANNTVEGRDIHSLHAYFLRPGDAKQSIRYEVDRLRDGRSFTTRRVVAYQKNRAIFNLAASFQIKEEGFDHHVTAPFVPAPENFSTDLDLARRRAQQLPDNIRDKFICDRPFEICTVDSVDWFEPRKRPPVKYIWFRTVSPVKADPMIHKALLAYVSDFGLIGTAMLPHGVSFAQKDMQVASLDHAIWFHRDEPLNDWMLYCMDSPSAYGYRGLARGQIFTKSGKLVAAVAQEGLMRKRG